MRHPQAVIASLAALFLLGCTSNTSTAEVRQPAEEPPLRVLFVGNSYTGVNNLPGLVTALSEAAGGRRIETARHTVGGCTLQRHFAETGAVEKIREGKWDVVVLQEQSMLPILQKDLMHQYARKLHAEIKASGAKTVFYLTWAREKTPETQKDLDAAYFGIAKELGATVAPVGRAWQEARRRDPAVKLYAGDGSHPSAKGSYLAAVVFYATLLRKSPLGLSGKVVVSGRTAVDLSPAEARTLQEAAQAAMR